jgi:hypothetical protein
VCACMCSLCVPLLTLLSAGYSAVGIRAVGSVHREELWHDDLSLGRHA